MPTSDDSTITLRDGRRLAYTEWGTPDGRPVLYFHGMPGSRTWCPDESATNDADVRLIVPDRPGVGRSDPKVRRTLSDWPADVVELADALGVSTFAVIGVSAGGPYAAACAALIPARLTNVAIVSSRPLSKWNWEEHGIQDDWTADQRAEFDLTQKDVEAGADLAATNFAEWAAALEQHPELLRDELARAEGDRWFFDDPGRVEIFDTHVREVWKQGFDALKWELIDVYQPWGFRLADIGVDVQIFAGSQDPWVTTAHIEYQAEAIPRSSVVIWSDSGHLAFVKHWGEILRAVARPTLAGS